MMDIFCCMGNRPRVGVAPVPPVQLQATATTTTDATTTTTTTTIDTDLKAAAEEKRISPDDGVAYSKQEFLQYYGDLQTWEAAAPKEKRASEKRRSLDGNAYSKEEFSQFFGEKEGEKEWAQAPPAEAAEEKE
mmetsp:Transcript_67369/g.106622  ORF Transcript_67369/g.106622 Transcript_67369/m.106622 type:complete len:133 (-) Transcript_67369:12-410(-)